MTDAAVHVTRPLLEALLDLAADREPQSVSVPISTWPAEDLEGIEGPGTALTDVPSRTPVFAEFSFPGAGDAVNRVFGVELGQPARSSGGRFVSHPDADPDLSSRDDLAQRVLVAVPPWEFDDVRAYDRNGRRLPLRTVAAGAPEAVLDEDSAEGL